MLISDVFVENHFENSSVIGLSYGEIVRCTLKIQYNVTKCNKKTHLALLFTKQRVLKCILLASKPLITMQIPHNFIKHVRLQ